MNLGLLPAPLENGANSRSVITKAFEILRVFSPRQRVMTVSEIARATGLPKSTAYRVLSTLVEVGAVRRVREGYMVGISMFALGALSLDNEYLDASFPILQRLQAVTGRTVHLTCLSDDRITILNKLAGARSPIVPTNIGREIQAQTTAAGKALLAFRDPEQTLLASNVYRETTTTMDCPEALGDYLRNISLYGVAVQREELFPGVSCVAAPILAEGTAVAAVSVTMHAADDQFRAVGTSVRRAADAINKSLRAAG